MTNDFPFEIFTVKNSCFTSIHNYGSVILWNLNFGSFCEWRHKFARSSNICVILSDHCIIVPYLNDKWFFYHNLYHPKVLWFIHMAQWYCEILILVHFASDGTSLPDLEACVILSDHCIIVPHLNDKLFFFHKLYHPKLLWFIHNVQWYCEILILVHFASDGTSLRDLEAHVSFWVTTVLLFHI